MKWQIPNEELEICPIRRTDEICSDSRCSSPARCRSAGLAVAGVAAEQGACLHGRRRWCVHGLEVLLRCGRQVQQLQLTCPDLSLFCPHFRGGCVCTVHALCGAFLCMLCCVCRSPSIVHALLCVQVSFNQHRHLHRKKMRGSCEWAAD